MNKSGKPTPRVKGNEVIFDAPELETNVTHKNKNFALDVKFGSIELDMTKGHRIEKNANGVVTRIEKFNPNICKIVWEEDNNKKWWQIWKT